MSFKRSNFTLVFFKAACHAKPGAVKSEQDQVHISQGTYVRSSQIHQLTIMTRFEHANHDILLNLLFQKLYKLFLRTCNLH